MFMITTFRTSHRSLGLPEKYFRQVQYDAQTHAHTKYKVKYLHYKKLLHWSLERTLSSVI